MRGRVPSLVAVLVGLTMASCAPQGESSSEAGQPAGVMTTGVATAPGATPPARAETGLPPCPESTDAEPVAGGLPDLTLDCLGEGPAVTLSGLRGTPLVVNVWSSWCDPCIREMPRLDAVRDEAEGKVQFLGINFLDAEGPARETARDLEMGFPSVVDPEGAIRTPLRVPGPPTTFFVRADGRIAHVEYGEIGSADELRDLVDQHLGVRL